MKFTNGKYLMCVGVIHTLVSFFPAVFLAQWIEFANGFFLNVSPHGGGPIAINNYASEAAFWFISWGVLLIFFGWILDFVEKAYGEVPQPLKKPWLAFAALCTAMLPASGFPIFVLPHALWMNLRKKS